MKTRLLFVEPPKDYWFLMGEYLPPPTGLLALAAYVERELEGVEVAVLDCQAEEKDWKDVENYFSSFSPDIVASSGFTCNAYVCAKVAETAKKVNPRIVTIMGGQHFSSTDVESLTSFPEIDLIVRGEGERTLVELISALRAKGDLGKVDGLTFRNGDRMVRTPDRELIADLDSLPYPAYHLVEGNLSKYHFTMMAGKKRYLILEGSRGCWHKCAFCTQWRHWSGTWRSKSPKRLAEEMAHMRDDLGAGFIWLTDDNFEYSKRGEDLARELDVQRFDESTAWFFQSRTDDIARHPETVSRLRKVGNNWQLVGVESGSPQTLKDFKKGETVGDAKEAVRILKENGVFSQAMLVIGSRSDGHASIQAARDFIHELDPHLVIYSILTPLPGTEVHTEALKNGWLEDRNYAHYDMAHAIMPTETLSRTEVQGELYDCYKDFYGSPLKAIRGIFSSNEIMKNVYRHLAGKRVLGSLRQLI
ncbi:MAG TPA: radical SAM protein [Methanomassiliicoccales archaeon]|nr:radical SAM protein [Methanomassiliicoccales archaeon]